MRYLRLYLYFLRFSFSKAMEFRVDFFFRIAMDCVYYAVQLGFFTLIYNHTTMLGGWELWQIYIFITGAMLVDALQMTFVANNLWYLPDLINKGDLDYYLVRPVSSLFFLSLREFAANSFLNLLIAAGLSAWAIGRAPQPMGAVEIAFYIVFLLLGSFIFYLLRMLFLIPVFWTHSGRGFEEIVWSLSRLGDQPHQIYAEWLKRALLTVLPLGLMASVPAHALFSGEVWRALAHVTVVAAVLFAVVALFWRSGLRAYSSASS
ncbi:MAG: ABC-2 family transporter protein [Acidobacteriota bacterium]